MNKTSVFVIDQMHSKTTKNREDESNKPLNRLVESAGNSVQCFKLVGASMNQPFFFTFPKIITATAKRVKLNEVYDKSIVKHDRAAIFIHWTRT